MNDKSVHFCYDCAFKHLSTARVLWTEMNNGWFNPDHLSFLIGNLHAAEVHLFERHPNIAKRIREYRKNLWDDAVMEDRIYYIPFDTLLNELWKHITEMGSLEDENGKEEE